MPDLKLVSWARWHQVSNVETEALKTEKLRPVAEAYHENILRLLALVTFPAMALTYSLRQTIILAETLCKATGEYPLRDDDPRLAAALPAFAQNFQKYKMDRNKELRASQEKGELAERLKNEILTGLMKLDEAARDMQVLGEHGGTAWLAAQVTSAWTSTETLCGDLWEAALNAHPHGLAELKGDKRRIKQTGKPQRDAESVQGSDKHVPLPLVMMHGYDLREKMGSVLRERMSFDRLDKIREAYSLAFFKDNEIVDWCLSHESVEAISLLRNAIVHRAGRADAQYLARSKNLKILPDTALGEPIVLDGELLFRLVSDVTYCCVTLISAVDLWITQHD